MGGHEGIEGGERRMGVSKAMHEKRRQVGKEKLTRILQINREGQLENAKSRKENNSEKSPVDDVVDVLTYVLKQDESVNDTRNLTRYVAWVKKNINAIEKYSVPKNELRKEEQITSSVGAGGAGRQTSKNARANVHIITGYRETAEATRDATHNVISYKEKMNDDLKRHLRNWRVMVGEVNEKAIVDVDIVDKVVKGLA